MTDYRNLNTEEKTELTKFFNQITIGDCEDKGVDFTKIYKAFKAIMQEAQIKTKTK